jgi:hypothetical protein
MTIVNRWGCDNNSRRTAGDENDSDPRDDRRSDRVGDWWPRRPGQTVLQRGVSIYANELDGKRQEILIEAVPGSRRMVAIADVNTIAVDHFQTLQVRLVDPRRDRPHPQRAQAVLTLAAKRRSSSFAPDW